MYKPPIATIGIIIEPIGLETKSVALFINCCGNVNVLTAALAPLSNIPPNPPKNFEAPSSECLFPIL